jgi:hypothetical protein
MEGSVVELPPEINVTGTIVGVPPSSGIKDTLPLKTPAARPPGKALICTAAGVVVERAGTVNHPDELATARNAMGFEVFAPALTVMVWVSASEAPGWATSVILEGFGTSLEFSGAADPTARITLTTAPMPLAESVTCPR